MPNIETETVYTVSLTEAEQQQLSTEGIEVDLPDGNKIRISGEGAVTTRENVREGVEAASDDDASPEEIEKLVRSAQAEQPDPAEEDEGEPGGGIITKNGDGGPSG